MRKTVFRGLVLVPVIWTVIPALGVTSWVFYHRRNASANLKFDQAGFAASLYQHGASDGHPNFELESVSQRSQPPYLERRGRNQRLRVDSLSKPCSRKAGRVRKGCGENSGPSRSIVTCRAPEKSYLWAEK
ncbi:hypothetical protein EDB92DRAFT_1883405 [Lactarius akahatsu]|uniref:Uncharacterized protein n=1 Tax=Lactarius akahatsu TaxID=416441 RepID=A0AAD4LB45_9AGAM|nr:hypothetical protein EDB92DRAFT_1883405 [Lactarius akahatsu]